MSWAPDAALAIVAASAALVAVFHRLDISAWYDEAFSYGISTQSWQIFFGRWVWGSEPNMVLYYVILHGWLGLLKLVGLAPTEVLLRVPSALFAVAAAVAVFALGRRLFGRIAGIIAAGLFLANFLQMILAQNARAYSLGLLLLSLSWLALFIALEKSTTRWWGLYVATSVLAVYALLFSSLVLVSQDVAIGTLLILPGPWKALARKAIRRLVASTALILILVLPIGADAVIHGGPVWVTPVHLGDLRAFFRFLGGGFRAYELVVFAAMGLALILAGAKRLPRFAAITRATEWSLGTTVAMASWFVVPIGISFALTSPWLNLHLFFARYLVVVVPPMCLLAGFAVAALPLRLLQAALAIALAVVAWPPLTLYYQEAQVQDFKHPTIWIQQRYQQADGIVCDPDLECGIPVGYYLQAYPGPAHLDRDSPGRFSWVDNSSVSVTPDTLRAYAGHHRRIFFIYGPLGQNQVLNAEAATLEAQLTAGGYRLVDQFEARGTAVNISVRVYEATAGGT
ncbi:MAG: hypothetical protein ACYDA0_11805 [Candidatus Dormibacteraceae bacterium]